MESSRGEGVEVFVTELTCVSVHTCASSSGPAAVVYRRLDGPLHVAERQRPRQLLHPLPDSSGRPAGHGPARAQLSLSVGDRGPGQRRGGLSPKRTPAMGAVALQDKFLLDFFSTNAQFQHVFDSMSQAVAVGEWPQVAGDSHLRVVTSGLDPLAEMSDERITCVGVQWSILPPPPHNS